MAYITYDFKVNMQKKCFGKADKDSIQNTFILSRMSKEGCIAIFVEIYIYFMFMSIMSLQH